MIVRHWHVGASHSPSSIPNTVRVAAISFDRAQMEWMNLVDSEIDAMEYKDPEWYGYLRSITRAVDSHTESSMHVIADKSHRENGRAVMISGSLYYLWPCAETDCMVPDFDAPDLFDCLDGLLDAARAAHVHPDIENDKASDLAGILLGMVGLDPDSNDAMGIPVDGNAFHVLKLAILLVPELALLAEAHLPEEVDK